MVPEQLLSSARPIGIVYDFTDLPIKGQEENISPFNKHRLNLTYQRLGMSHEFEIGVEDSKCRRVVHIISAASEHSGDGRPRRLCCLRRRYQSHISLERFNELLRSFISKSRSSAVRTIVVDGVVSHNDNVSRLSINGHTSDATSRVLKRLRRLSLTSARNGQSQDPTCRSEKESRRRGALSKLDTSDRLLRFEHDALSRSAIMDEVSSDKSYRAICKADSELGQVFQCGKS